jgi:hypothetical protein
MYFFDETETNHGAVRDLALRAAGLSEHSLKAISDMVDSARSLQAQPPARRSRPRHPPDPHLQTLISTSTLLTPILESEG